MTKQELKPCPFCGKKPKIVKNKAFTEINNSNFYKIGCISNSCLINPISGWSTDKSKLIKSWNKRADK